MVSVRLIGAAVFMLLLGFGVPALVAIVRGLTGARTAARFTPAAPGKPATGRPCAVYEIDLTDGRKYIGYGFNPHQRIMQTHRRAAWFRLALTAGRTLEPDRVDWYATDEIAHAEEIRRIRSAPPKTLVNKILYKEGAA